MPRVLLLAGPPAAATAAAAAWWDGRPGAAVLDVAAVAAGVVASVPGPAGEGVEPGTAAVAATCAAAVELVAGGYDVVVAGGPADQAAYVATWLGHLDRVDHRVAVVGDGGDWPEAHRLPAGPPAATAAAVRAQLAVPGWAWHADVVEGDGLRLRPLRPSDAPAVVAACQDPEIPRWTTVPSPYTEAHAVEFVRRAAADRRRGTAAVFAVAELPGDELVGTIGLVDVDRRVGVATVGYWLGAPARGRRVASRALRLLDRWAFERVGVERLQLHVLVGNDSSARVAEAAGYRREGLHRGAFRHRDARVDAVVYGLLRTDLPAGDATGR